MDFSDLIQCRKSTRKFTEEPLSEQALASLLLAANSAPIGSRRYEDIHLSVVQNREMLTQLTQAAKKLAGDRARMQAIAGSSPRPAAAPNRQFDPFFAAPAVIVVSHRNQTVQPGIEYANAACVAYTLHLAATDLGLGSFLLWGVFEAMKLFPECDNSSLLKLPDDFQPVMGVAVGHPDAPLTAREIDAERFAVDYF